MISINQWQHEYAAIFTKGKKMKAYVIGNYNIIDEPHYMKYATEVPASVAKFEGQTLVVEAAATILEGTPATYTVIVVFPSMAKANSWYHSSEYQKIISYRKKSTTGWVQIVSEFSMPLLSENQQSSQPGSEDINE